jgi:hypothetical protein
VNARFGRALCVLAAAALALTAVGTSQSQAGDAPFKVRTAKEKGGPYKLVTRVNLDRGEKTTAWWRVRSQADETLALEFNDDDTEYAGYRVRWFKHGDDATDAVKGDGRPFNLDPGESKYFSAKIKRRASSENKTCLIGVAFDAVEVDQDLGYLGVNETCVS